MGNILSWTHDLQHQKVNLLGVSIQHVSLLANLLLLWLHAVLTCCYDVVCCALHAPDYQLTRCCCFQTTVPDKTSSHGSILICTSNDGMGTDAAAASEAGSGSCTILCYFMQHAPVQYKIPVLESFQHVHGCSFGCMKCTIPVVLSVDMSAVDGNAQT